MTLLSHESPDSRPGKILVLFTILLPTLLAMTGLVLDGGTLMLDARHAQHAADAAATAAATQLRLGRSTATAQSAAQAEVQTVYGWPDATVTVTRPPQSGAYAGSQQHVHVRIKRDTPLQFMPLVTGNWQEQVVAEATAGYEDSTAGAAVVVLDPSPAPLSILNLPLLLPSLPSLIGGLEVLGLGKAEVHGAVLVNCKWGGVDEQGQPAGSNSGPPYAVACTPLLSLSKLKARDLRVVGGVDRKQNYSPLASNQPAPLKANRMPVLDPLRDLPVPTIAVDPANVRSTNHGGKLLIGLPIGPAIRLTPGVYDWIDVVAGRVIFEPGIYIIRGKHPVTNHSLTLLAGTIEAEGVMFYLTNSAAYSATSGAPDSADGQSEPAAAGVGVLVPSAVINLGLLGSSFTPLNSPSSPFHGMMFYQRRHDRRPIVFVQENLLGAGRLEGTVYAKWGHVLLAGKGDYNARFVSGTMRILALLDLRIMPTNLLPAAQDVFLVQ
jgi:Flp pilus assembly protein TadG